MSLHRSGPRAHAEAHAAGGVAHVVATRSSAPGDAARGDERPILAVLRERTRQEHEAVERALGLMSDALTLPAYQRTLERFHGFWQPVEQRFHRTVGLRELGIDPSARAKTPLLVDDLRALGISDPDGLPRCDDVPAVDSLPAALGSMYVLEGSSLGGQIISRHLRARLGVTRETGGRFFHGYGEATGEMWRAFSASVSAFPVTPRARETMVEAAIATFRLLRRWCERDQPLPMQ